MPDTVSVTTSQGWLSRIGTAIIGGLIGLVLVAGAFPLLWWNEGRAVHRARSLAEGASIVIDVPADAVSPANEGKLVHIAGLATTSHTITDPDFGISAVALRLERVAETYQWHEDSSTSKRKKFGGGEETTKTYHYTKKWAGRQVDSTGFNSPGGHENPPVRWEPRTINAPVTVGAFTVPPQLVSQIGGSEARPGEAGDAEKMGVWRFRVAPDGFFYRGNPADPQIGDVRVKFQVVLPRTVSIVAAQRGSSLAAYEARAGSDILLLQDGQVAAAEMFKAEQKSNTITTWVLRGAGFLAMFIGMLLLLRPISVIASVVPVLGSIVGMGTGLLALFISLAQALTTIALAWVVYRPLLGASLLAGAAGAIVLLVHTHRRKRLVVPPPIPVMPQQ